MRPRSDDSQKPSFLDLDSPSSSRRSSLINGRPPSMSLSFRSNSDASLSSLNFQSDARQSNGSRFNSDSSVGSQVGSTTSSNPTTIPSTPSSESEIKLEHDAVEDEKSTTPQLVPSASQSTRRLRPLSMSFKAGLIQRIPEGKQVSAPESSSPPPPLPPVPSLSRMPTLPVGTSAGLWAAKPAATTPRPTQDEGLPWQPRQRAVTATRSILPPFQIPEQNDSPIEVNSKPYEQGFACPDVSKVASQLSQPQTTSASPAGLALQLESTAVATSPVSPIPTKHAEVSPPPPLLSVQIISTAVHTAPISPIQSSRRSPQTTLSIQTSTLSTKPIQPTLPPPPSLSLQLSSISTAPTSPLPQRPIIATASSAPLKPTTSTSTQTSPPPSPLRTALRIDTDVAAPAFPRHSYSFSTTSSALDLETPDDFYEPPPVFMGRMMDYYSKPGYQLGASLFGGYSGPVYEEVVVEGELTEWERANGRGY